MASYLSERRYMKSLNSNNQSVDSTKNQKRSHHFDINKGRKRILFTTKSLASLIYKLIPTKNSEELSNCTRSNKDDDISETRKTWRIEKKHWIFSIKCLNAYRSTNSNVKEHSLHSKRHPVFTHASTSVTFNIENLKVKVQQLLIIKHGSKDAFQISLQFFLQHYFATVSLIMLTY